MDFEFPDENGKPYKSGGGEMEFNKELEKEIPTVFTVQSISNVLPVKDGTHDSPNPTNEGHPLVTSTHLKPYGVASKDAYLISEEDFIEISRRSQVDKHDILFSMIGTVGSISYVLKEKVDFAIKNVGLFKASKNQVYAEYLLLFLKSTFTTRYINTCLLGSTQNYVTLSELRNIPLLVPDGDVLSKFNHLIHPVISSLSNYALQIDALDSLTSIFLGKITQG